MMDDSLQQLLDAAEPEFPTQNAIILSTTTVGSGSDSAAEINHSKLEAAMTRRRPAPRGTAAYPRKRAPSTTIGRAVSSKLWISASRPTIWARSQHSHH